MSSSNDMERKMKLEQLKQSENKLVSRAATIISKDTSDRIVANMRDEWKYCEVQIDGKQKETKDNDEFIRQVTFKSDT